jgi:hypothetical protein
MFVADENVYVFPHLPLFGYDAIANARVECTEGGQRLG